MYHRGPDDIGIYIDEKSKVGLGHAQLSITCSNEKHQLIHNKDRTIHIVFDGAVYNLKELKDSLKETHQFSTSSEYEVLIHLYEEKGDNFINDLNGMFAFALWDLNKEQMIISKDRFGIKPLYYTVVNGVFLFASEIKALLKYPNVSQELDHSFVKCFIGLKCIPSPYTLHKGIYSLSHGHLLVCNKNGISKQKKYWHLESLFVNEETNFPEDYYVSEIYKIISDSIKIRMLPEGPNGLFLSGGVDSGLLVGMMSQQSSQPIEAYSVGFEESHEFINSQRIAKMFNCNYHEYMLTRKDFFDLLPEVISYSEDPVGDCAAIPLYHLSQKAGSVPI